MVVGVRSSEFMGRKPELARLEDVLGVVSSGSGATVLVGGEAGIGKSRLVGELSAKARRFGFRVAFGASAPLEGRGLPYGTVVAVMRHLERQLDAAQAAQMLGPAFAALGLPLADGTAGDAADRPLAGPYAKTWLFEVLLRGFASVAEACPTMLVLEDLHWADAGTLGVLDFLTRNLGRARLLVACTYRTDEQQSRESLDSFLAELGRCPQVSTIVLGGLEDRHVEGLVAAVLGRRPERALVDAVRARAGGNPFFVEELIDSGAPSQWSPTLSAAVAGRIAGMSAQARQVLGAASAMAGAADHALLGETSGLGGQDLDDAVRECLDRHVFVRSRSGKGDYVFRHDLVREAVYDSLLPSERARMHHRIASVVSACSSPGAVGGGYSEAELATHWWAAGEWDAALRTSFAAGRAAFEVFAFDEAVVHFEHALDAHGRLAEGGGEPEVPLSVLLEWAADAAHHAGTGAGSIELARAVLATIDSEGEPLRAAMAYVRLARNLWAVSDPAASFRALASAEELLPSEPPTLELARTLAEKGRCLMLMSRFEEGELVCRRAVSVARAAGDRQDEGHALNSLGVCLGHQGLWDEGIAMVREAIEIAEELHSPWDMSRGYSNVGALLDGAGRLEEVVDIITTKASPGEDIGGVRLQGAALNAADALVDLGRWDEAETVAARVAKLPGNCGNHPGSLRAKLAVRRGRFDHAQAELDVIDENTRLLDDLQFRARFLLLVAELSLFRGRPQQGHDAVGQALTLAASTDDTTFVPEMCALGARALADTLAEARASGRRHDADKLRLLAAELAERAAGCVARSHARGGTCAPRAAAMEAQCAAEVTRLYGPDPEAWMQAARHWQQLHQPYETAYCHMREAEALLMSRARRGRATDLLGQAWRTCSSLGAAPLLSEVEALAGRAGIPVGAETEEERRRAELGSDLGLTPREVEVLGCLAVGRTDGQIAEALFISKKTASVHVSNIIRKLDAGSRYEAGEIGRKVGLGVKSAVLG